MPVVVGIRFKDSGKTYFFDPNHLEPLQQGDYVIVETVRGPEIAKVAYPPRPVDESEIVGELKPVIRRAEQADFERLRQLNERQDELMARCAEKIAEHDLPMRLVRAEYSFDGSRLTFYFTAEKRVDFRMLVRDLARTFRARIELRQIGPRDEAKLIGGIGPCGRLLCCATFLPDYARVSIKMAKDQDLPLNPSKISGVCGRLLCCLSYEHEQYLDIKANLPRKGTWVQTPDGPGEVVAVNVVRETVTVRLANSGVEEEYAPAQVQEATQQVAELARSRNAAGITPAAQRNKEQLAAPREPKHSGERRMLRDEIDNPEVLEALSWLEDGFDEDADPPARGETSRRTPNDVRRQARSARSDPRVKAARDEAPPRNQASPNEGSKSDMGLHRERSHAAARRQDDHAVNQDAAPADKERQGQPPAERGRLHRRRRKRGGERGA